MRDIKKLMVKVEIKRNKVILDLDEWRHLCDAFHDLAIENERLESRLRHLLQSEFIRTFDAKRGGQYVKNIEELDTTITILNDKQMQQEILYLCDGKKCPNCCERECEITADIRHAKNFKKIGDVYVEQESGGDTFITNYYYSSQKKVDG